VDEIDNDSLENEEEKEKDKKREQK